MCRALAYLGTRIALDQLLYKPDSSLITQAYDPKRMTEVPQNLGGFGLLAWDALSEVPKLPHIYRTHLLPFYDDNLSNLASKVRANCVLAHVRGVEYNNETAVSNQNVHPFLFQNTDIAFAHNGDLAGFEAIRYELATYMKPEYRAQIKGTTDTEWMYALFLSVLKDGRKKHTVEDIHRGIVSMLDIIRSIRKKKKIFYSSSLNFFISNGEVIFVIRYILDFGHYPPKEEGVLRGYTSLWYTFGEEYGEFEGEYKMKGGKTRKSIIIASEPLTSDYTTWIEVPEYSFISASLKNGEIFMKSANIDP